MARNLDDIYIKYDNLKDFVASTCDRRVEKSVLERHVDKNDLDIIELHNRIDLSNTEVNNRMNNLMWKGIVGIVGTVTIYTAGYFILEDNIVSLNIDRQVYQIQIIDKLNSINTTVNINKVKMEYMLDDIRELKEGNEHVKR